MLLAIPPMKWISKCAAAMIASLMPWSQTFAITAATVRPALQARHGRVRFAGEHLAEWQGFMEGAVVTGIDAAKAL